MMKKYLLLIRRLENVSLHKHTEVSCYSTHRASYSAIPVSPVHLLSPTSYTCLVCAAIMCSGCGAAGMCICLYHQAFPLPQLFATLRGGGDRGEGTRL